MKRFLVLLLAISLIFTFKYQQYSFP